MATVKRTTVVKFPAKEGPARAELERALKEQGRWEEVSELSLRSLARALEAARCLTSEPFRAIWITEKR